MFTLVVEEDSFLNSELFDKSREDQRGQRQIILTTYHKYCLNILRLIQHFYVKSLQEG